MSAKIAVAGLLKFMGMAVYFGLFAYFVSRSNGAQCLTAVEFTCNKIHLKSDYVGQTPQR